jgi:hypothetical protein
MHCLTATLLLEVLLFSTAFLVPKCNVVAAARDSQSPSGHRLGELFMSSESSPSSYSSQEVSSEDEDTVDRVRHSVQLDGASRRRFLSSFLCLFLAISTELKICKRSYE